MELLTHFYFYQITTTLLLVCFVFYALFQALRAGISRIRTYKKLCKFFFFFITLKFGFDFIANDFLGLITDVILFGVSVFVYKNLHSPFYKALDFLQQNDYANLYECLKGFKNWYLQQNIKGLSLLHYAILQDDNLSLLKLMLGEEIRFNPYDENSSVDKLMQSQKRIKIKLSLFENERRKALELPLGKRARVQICGLKGVRILFLHGANAFDLAAVKGDVYILALLANFKADTGKAVHSRQFDFALYPEHFALFNAKFIALAWLFEQNESAKEHLQGFLKNENIDALRLNILFDEVENIKHFYPKFAQNTHPAFLAAAFGKIKALEFFLSKEPNLKEQKNSENDDLLDLAIKFQNLQSFEFLHKAGLNFGGKLFLALCEGSKEITQYMLENGYKISAEEMCCLYYLWFDSDDEALFKRLCEIGTDFIDQEGDTPLLVATKANLTQKAKKLILAGANVDIKDKNGKTAFDYAKEYQNKTLCDLLDRSFEESF